METPLLDPPEEVAADRRALADVLLIAGAYLLPNIYFAFEYWFYHTPPPPVALGELGMAVRAVGFAVLGLYLILRSGQPPAEFGLVRPTVSDLFLGLGVWLGLFVLHLATSRLIPANLFGLPVPPSSDFYLPPRTAVDFGLVAVASVCNGFGEEVVMRAVLQTRLQRLMRSSAGAVMLTAFLFALYHAHYGPAGVMQLFLSGIVYGVLFRLSGRLWPVAVAHALSDFMPMVWLAGR